MTSFAEAVAWIDNRSAWNRGYINDPGAGESAARLGLLRTRAILDALGSPDGDLVLFHVAGSKGKGSTSTFVQSILTVAGVRTGRFTSPHLHSYRERFVIDGEDISETDFANLMGRVAPVVEAVEQSHPELGTTTAFEAVTCAAMAWFSSNGCTAAVIEVGVGGLLDATNVIRPAVSIITMLELEHTAILGPTLRDIAVNKAGIIKHNTPVVTIAQPVEAMTVIETRAKAFNAPLTVIGREVQIAEADGYSTLSEHNQPPLTLCLAMPGRHQVENAALAVTAVRRAIDAHVIEPIANEMFEQGLASVTLPGRTDVLDLTTGQRLIVDGAHTPASVAALAGILHTDKGDRVVAIVGMLRDRDPKEVIAPLVTVIDRLIAVEAPSPRALPSETIATAASHLGIEATVATSLTNALADAIAFPADTVVITGSMTLVAELYRYRDSGNFPHLR